jgi:hypothetical protein
MKITKHMLENIIREELSNVIKEQDSAGLIDAIAKYNTGVAKASTLRLEDFKGQKITAIAKMAIELEQKTNLALEDKNLKDLVVLFQTAKKLDNAILQRNGNVVPNFEDVYKQLVGDVSVGEKIEQSIKNLDPAAIKGAESGRDFMENKMNVLRGINNLAMNAMKKGNQRGFDNFQAHFNKAKAMASQSELDKSGYMQFAEYAEKEPNQ